MVLCQGRKGCRHQHVILQQSQAVAHELTHASITTVAFTLFVEDLAESSHTGHGRRQLRSLRRGLQGLLLRAYRTQQLQ